MFLTRSKTTVGRLCDYTEKNQTQKQSVKLPSIPSDQYSIIKDALPSIEVALEPVVPNSAHVLIVDMLSSWVQQSQPTVVLPLTANNTINTTTFELPKQDIPKIALNKQKSRETWQPVKLIRSWTTRSFSTRVVPKNDTWQKGGPVTEISDVVSSSDRSQITSQSIPPPRTPSLTNSSTSSLSARHSLPEIAENPESTPPLQASLKDTSSISILDLTNQRSENAHYNHPEEDDEDDDDEEENDDTNDTLNHHQQQQQQQQQSNSLKEEDSVIHPPASILSSTNQVYDRSKLPCEVNESALIQLNGPRYVRRSFSTMISNLGQSVKKVFNKKKSRYSSENQHYNRLMKTMSVQHNLAYHDNDKNTPAMSPSSTLVRDLKKYQTSKREYTTGEQCSQKNDSDIFTTSIHSKIRFEQQQQLLQKRQSDVYSKRSSLHEINNESNYQQQLGAVNAELQTNSSRHQSLYWDDNGTQSQQFDKLLGDIWERSQEYQGYFASATEEEEEEEAAATASMVSNPMTIDRNLLNCTWSPPEQRQSEFNGKSKKVRSSKTEGNIKYEESVPYVCVGQPAILEISESDNEDEVNDIVKDTIVKSKKQRIKSLNIEDAKAYKRSTSAYSTIHDYDLNWQQSFHIQQKNKDKVGRTLKSVSWAFYNIIKRNHGLSEFSCDPIFDESESTPEDYSTYKHCSEPLTDWTDIYEQLAYVFDCGELTSEHAIITFIYVRRMLERSNQRLWDFSWRMIVMSSLLTAVKVWDDCAIFNADFAMIFPELSLDIINTIERVFLTYLEWDVSVSCSDFARTYFYLRDIQHMMNQW